MTVFARELTARGRGAIAVLELVGAQALARVAELSSTALPEPGGFRLVRLRLGGELLDEALCYVASAERIELHLHGSPPLVARVVEALGAERRRDAATLEERAQSLLGHARTAAAARLLLDQAEGALRRELEALDPRDEPSFRAAVAALLARGRVAQALVVPRRVVLAGPVNAGKSTLFNALLGRERVVVAAEPGTTRDAVREEARLEDYPVELIDTAGERELTPSLPCGSEHGAARVEAAGQERARTLQRAADLVLWLRPAPELPAVSARLPASSTAALRVLVSRGDLLRSPAGVEDPVVAAERAPDEARRVVARVFREALGLPRAPWTPGAGVPYEAELCRRLEELPELEPRAREERLGRLLAR